jgi:hypothetical protein
MTFVKSLILTKVPGICQIIVHLLILIRFTSRIVNNHWATENPFLLVYVFLWVTLNLANSLRNKKVMTFMQVYLAFISISAWPFNNIIILANKLTYHSSDSSS